MGDVQTTAYTVGADALFKSGDKVTIEIGYYPNLQTRFTGYITKVSSTTPVKITCEDKMWLLKQTNVILPDPKTFTTTAKTTTNYDTNNAKYTLSQLMDTILSNTKEKITYTTVNNNFDLGNLTFNNVSAAQVLQTLKDTYGLYSYFKDEGSLYVGFYNDIISNNIQGFAMEEVVIDDDNLEWTNASDVAVKVQGVTTDTKGVTTTYEARFDNGKIIQGTTLDTTVAFTGDVKVKNTKNQSADSLQTMVLNLLPAFTYTGFKGDIKTLGEPFVSHGDICKLSSTKMPERNGYYLIKGIKITDGTKGYFQTLTLGIALQVT